MELISDFALAYHLAMVVDRIYGKPRPARCYDLWQIIQRRSLTARSNQLAAGGDVSTVIDVRGVRVIEGVDLPSAVLTPNKNPAAEWTSDCSSDLPNIVDSMSFAANISAW